MNWSWLRQRAELKRTFYFIRHESRGCKLVRNLDPFVTFSKAWLWAKFDWQSKSLTRRVSHVHLVFYAPLFFCEWFILCVISFLSVVYFNISLSPCCFLTHYIFPSLFPSFNFSQSLFYFYLCLPLSVPFCFQNCAYIS